jgi:hypothetical protein
MENKKDIIRKIIKEKVNKKTLLEEKNKKASNINKTLSELIEKMKKDFNISNE